MRIVIVGGGNIGTQFAVHCAEKGHEVIIYTSSPEVFQNHLKIVDIDGSITHEGDILLATSDPAEAFSNCELVIVTYPSDQMQKAAEVMKNYVNPNTLIGVVPGNGGSECVFHEFIERGNTFFMLERVPAIARLVKKGSTVRSTGYRKELHLSALPRSNAEMCSAIISSLFDMDCKTIPYLLNLTMTPSNPILHTTRLKTIFKDYAPGVIYDHIPLFYEEWSDESSELLLKCDDEVQAICKALPEHHLVNVKSLRDHYESYTAREMTMKISGIPAFKGITTPAVKVDGGFIPDLRSRYFTADFSFGLSIIKQIGAFSMTETPFINEVMEWYENIAVEKKSFNYAAYGIVDKQTFDRYYLR